MAASLMLVLLPALAVAQTGGYAAPPSVPPEVRAKLERLDESSRGQQRTLNDVSGKIGSLRSRVEDVDKEVRAVDRKIEAADTGLKARVGGLEKSAVVRDERLGALEEADKAQAARLEPIEQLNNDQEKRLAPIEQASQDIQRRFDPIEKRLESMEGAMKGNTRYLDRFWVLLAAALVFFMQAGFNALEVGMVRPHHRNTTGMKNLMDWLVLSLVFYFVGFAVMFGRTTTVGVGWDATLTTPTRQAIECAHQPAGPDRVACEQGIDLRAMEPKTEEGAAGASSGTTDHLGLEFFLFQLAFAGTAATIVSGAMAERTALFAYFVASLFMGIVIYPVFGHWAWGSLLIGDEASGWLENIGFIDFAGSTVVHSIGAWVALAGVQVVGPRLDRFDSRGKVVYDGYQSQNLGISILGVMILWLGWWGFNGGSLLEYNADVSRIVLNTNLAGAASGIVAYFHALWRDPDNLYEKMIGGVVGGLVAITACCQVIESPWLVVAVGGIAGIVHNYGFDFLIARRWDDPVGAIPVHGFCGVWGTLSVALFGDTQWFGDNTRIEQLGVQCIGILTAFLFAWILAAGFFRFMSRVVGLRMSPTEEIEGGGGGSGVLK